MPESLCEQADGRSDASPGGGSGELHSACQEDSSLETDPLIMQPLLLLHAQKQILFIHKPCF